MSETVGFRKPLLGSSTLIALIVAGWMMQPLDGPSSGTQDAVAPVKGLPPPWGEAAPVSAAGPEAASLEAVSAECASSAAASGAPARSGAALTVYMSCYVRMLAESPGLVCARDARRQLVTYSRSYFAFIAHEKLGEATPEDLVTALLAGGAPEPGRNAGTPPANDAFVEGLQVLSRKGALDLRRDYGHWFSIDAPQEVIDALTAAPAEENVCG